VIIGSNINGQPLDSERFRPILSDIERRDMPIFLHPTTPACWKTRLADYRLVPVVGFPFETTITAARLVFSGILAAHPKLKIVLAHLGGALPYLAGRIDTAFDAFDECRQATTQRPLNLLKKFYADAIAYYTPAIRCAVELLGADRLLFGTDYPFTIGAPSKILESIRQARLTETEEKAIHSETARKLLRL